MGLLVATLVAGGASAAPGGNGKNHNNGEARAGETKGKGNGLAKGHSKHTVAPAEVSQAPANTDQDEGKKKNKPHAAASKPKFGESQRAGHLTICHATGSGRYVVISPSVRGATNHLLKHDDDFAYVDGCDRSDEEPPGEDPPPGPPVDPPGGTGNPPHDPPSVAPGGPAAGSAGDLPFTGLPALAILLAGLAFVASGLLLVRRAGASG